MTNFSILVGFGFTATPASLSMSLSTSLSDTSIEQLAAEMGQSIIMEPIFAATTSETVTAQLQEQLDKAVAAVPPAHRLNPGRDEVFESKEAAFSRLQDWAFVKGCAIVKESAKSKGGQVNLHFYGALAFRCRSNHDLPTLKYFSSPAPD
jgi:hypothetical protein